MKLQVNATDYGGVQIEAFDGYDWSVPAWEEQGLGGLAGDVPEYTEHNGVRYVIGHCWSSVEAAQRALGSIKDMI